MISRSNISASSRVDFAPLAEQYDRWYATPMGKTHDRVQKHDVLRFLARVPRGARLLDVGCGTGHWTRFFASLGYAVVGMDLAFPMIQMAHKKKSSEICFQVANAGALPFKTASFDAVATMATLEFLVMPLKALNEMARCLRRGGLMLIGTLNRTARLNRQRLAEGREPYASGHLYSPTELRDLLRPFGQVRMAASNPDALPWGKDPSQLDGVTRGASLDGPFLVAEVRR